MTRSAKFRRQLQLWWPAVLVLLTGGILSVLLWGSLEKNNARTVQERLEQQAHLFTHSLEQRLFSYAEYLKSIRPLLGQVDPAGHEVFEHLDLLSGKDPRFPGFEALTVVRRMDAADYEAFREQLLHDVSARQRVSEAMMPDWPLTQSDYYIIENVWPSEVQAALVGMDVASQTPLRAQLDKLRSLDDPVMTEPFPLAETGSQAIGILLSVPIRTHSLEHAHDELLGALNLSIRADQLVKHLRERNMLQNLCVQIYDTTASEPAGAQKIFLARSWTPGRDTARTMRTLDVMGRQWTLEFAPRDRMLSDVERWFPGIIGASTLGATLLLTALVYLLSIKGVRAEVRVRAKRHQLRERTDRFRALFHQSAVGVAEIDPVLYAYVSMNQRFAEITEHSMDELLEKSVYDVIHPLDRQVCMQLERQLLQGTLPHYSTLLRLNLPQGKEGEKWCEVWVSPLLSADGQPLGRHIVLLMDVTERQRMQEQLRAREAYSSEMLRYMPVGFVVVGATGRIEFVNHQFEVMTGWTDEALFDETTMWSKLCPNHQEAAAMQHRLQAAGHNRASNDIPIPAREYVLRSRQGQELTVEISGRYMDGRLLLSFVDVGQRKAAEAKIRWLGYYDTLTHLPNRRLLLERLGEALTRSRKGAGSRGALLLLDLDNFKSLNETLGHEYGDELLCLVAKRLSGCIAGRHTLARHDGDEFAVVLEDLPADPLEAGRNTEQVGCTILQALRTPFYLGEHDLHVTVSMGAAVFTGQDDTVDELLKRADLALFQAKSAGRDTLQFFDPSMQQAVSARMEMEKDIRLALERHEFDLFYQPQVQNGQVTGGEALLRWPHPIKGYIPPDVFVSVAEESGLILQLGEWVLYAACRQLAQWARDPDMAHLTMSVNVSPRQFYQPDFVEQVQRALQVTGARAEQLDLELTEGMLLTDVEDTIRKMVQLKAMGVSFSLDDFGTGYSSLAYLKRLPLDKLKIDQGFVREVETSTNDAAIARSIIALGRSLGLEVIAEGVETEAQREFLASNGCHYWQGYLFSRPLPVEEFEAWTRAYNGACDAEELV